MEYLIVGLSNKTLPIALRERFYIQPEKRPDLLARLSSVEGVAECMVLSTCNRTEIHSVVCTTDAAFDLKRALCGFVRAVPAEAGGGWYAFRNGQAIGHLFRVASSLDAMVVGEPQIFSQVKDAYRQAFTSGATGSILNQILHRAFNVTKRVRTETGIGLGSTSVSSVAVDLIESSLCARYTPTVLIIGAGEAGAAAAKTISDRGLGRIVIANRTGERALALAREVGAEVASWDEIGDLIAHADAVITSCGAGLPIITEHMVRDARGRAARAGLLIIDLGVPRDADPAVGAIEGVTLHNIDGLKAVADRNIRKRESEMRMAERIVSSEALRTSAMLLESELEPTIASLVRKCDEIRRRELARAFERMDGLSGEQMRLMETCTASIVSKILHDPIVTLKEGTIEGEHKVRMIDFIRHVFRLG